VDGQTAREPERILDHRVSRPVALGGDAFGEFDRRDTIGAGGVGLAEAGVIGVGRRAVIAIGRAYITGVVDHGHRYAIAILAAGLERGGGHGAGGVERQLPFHDHGLGARRLRQRGQQTCARGALGETFER